MESESDKKLKKTRRGKKSGRRSRGRSWSEDCGDGALNILCNPSSSNPIPDQQNVSHQVDISRVKFHSPYNINEQSIKCNNRRYIRPRYSPKAPHNSTQFIMEDHECEYSGVQALSEYPEVVEEFYGFRDDEESKKSVTSGVYSPKDRCSSVGSEVNDCSTNSDLELDVEDLQIDNTFVFMANDFENCYHNARTEELSQLPREKLIEKIIDMENKVMELEHKLAKINRIQNLNEKKTSHCIKSEFMSDLSRQLQSLKREKQLLKQMKNDACI